MIASSSTAQAQQYEARTVAPRTIERTAQGQLLLGVTGAVLLGVPYVGSVWMAAESNREGDKLMYVPVVGPWATIVDRSVCMTPGCRGSIGTDSLPLVVDGLTQAAGLALVVIAISTPPTRVSPRPSAEAARLTLHVAPASYNAGAGIAAFGTF